MRIAPQPVQSLRLARAANRDARGGTLREQPRGMILHRRFVQALMLAGALSMTASCATAPKAGEPASRAKDSAPEKIAAQRAAAPHGVPLEADDARWGIEAARERKRQKDEAKARNPTADGDRRVDVTTPAP